MSISLTSNRKEPTALSLAPNRLAPMANAIRALSMDAVQAANSGHPGVPMGMADVATVLYANFLKFDPAARRWPDGDRFVLSADHGSSLLCSLHYLSGYESPTIEDIRNFCQLGPVCAGHPENFLIPGIECTTGPLGQWLAMAVGMAMAERHTWVIASDGCLMEVINHEAIGLAGNLKLGQFKVLWDDNRITIDGDTSLSTSEEVPVRFRAAGWDMFASDGHDFADIKRALDEAPASERPSLVACRTVIGKGALIKQGSHDVDGAALGTDEVAATRAHLSWSAAPFEIPTEILAGWRSLGERGAGLRAEWEARLAASPDATEFSRRMAGELPAGQEMAATFAGWLAGDTTVATRKASENALNVLASRLPESVGGSADLTGSNNTKAKCQAPFPAGDYAGRYVHYGIREFGMAAAMNGMALHGGVIPYGGTFLIFSDYCRNAIRLSALQQTRVVYVLTHDSIGLGEDGPTYQPIEQVMSLRLNPNLNVFHSCDVIETAECWMLALQSAETPSVLAPTRQSLPQLRTSGEMLSARGAYVLRRAAAERRVILITTGSEVELACKVRDALEAQGIGADVVSMPCMERFESQARAYQHEILPHDPSILRVSIKAGSTLGWERYIAPSRDSGLHRPRPLWRVGPSQEPVRRVWLYCDGGNGKIGATTILNPAPLNWCHL